MTSLREIELRLGKEAAFATFSLWRAKGRRERMKDKELRTADFGLRHAESGEKTKKNGGRKNGATGRSDIEGKTVRVTASDSGSERVSIRGRRRGDV